MRIWIPFAAIGGVIVVAIVAVVVLLSTRDVSSYKGLIEEKVKAATGRDLAIKGDLDLEISLTPAIAVEDVTFANAPWGSRPEMLKIDRLEAEVDLLSILFGTTKVERLVLIGADILLETDENGRGNWEFEERDEARRVDTDESEKEALAEGDGALPEIYDVRIEDLTLTYRDGVTGETSGITLDRVRGTWPGPDAPVTIDIVGAVNGADVEAEVTLGPGLKNMPIKMTGRLAGADVGIVGVIAEPMKAEGLDLALSVAGNSLADLDRLAGSELPAIGPYRITAKLTDVDGAYRLSALDIKLG